MHRIFALAVFLPALADCTAADMKVFNDVMQTASAGTASTGLSDSDITTG